MKSWTAFSFATVLVTLFASAAFSASPKVLAAVMKSKQIANVTDIMKVEVVGVGRCPLCYEIVVSGTNPTGEAYVKVQTEQVSTGKLEIRYLEGSK